MPQENILVIKLGALGDFIYAIGPMQAIKKHHQTASITLLTRSSFPPIKTGVILLLIKALAI